MAEQKRKGSANKRIGNRKTGKARHGALTGPHPARNPRGKVGPTWRVRGWGAAAMAG